MAQVLVTRAEPGASETAVRLKALGYEPVLAPALDISTHELQPDWPPSEDEHVIFTSANGVRAFVEAGWDMRPVCVCVGASTAGAAAAAGFVHIWNADGDSDAIIELISTQFEAGGPKWVHYANDAAAGEIYRRLNAQGFSVRFVPLYGARQVSAAEREDELRNFETGAVLVHSAKAAEAVASWLDLSNPDIKSMKLVAVSERAAEPLRGFGWDCVSVATRPNEEKLLEALQFVLEAGVSSD